MLKGSQLDEVKEFALNGLTFTPGEPAAADGGDGLSMVTVDAKAAGNLKEGEEATAKITLKDGRIPSSASQPRWRLRGPRSR